MKITAYVVSVDGVPWDGLDVEVVEPDERGGFLTVGRGSTAKGTLAVDAALSAVGGFGLLLAGKATLAVPQKVGADELALGTLVWAKEPLVALELFCAPEGQVYGLPKALAVRATAREVRAGKTLEAAPATSENAAPAATEAAAVAPSLGTMLARTGADLSDAQRSLVDQGGFVLGAITLKLRTAATADTSGGLKMAPIGAALTDVGEVQVTLLPSRTASAPPTQRLAAASLTAPAGMLPDPRYPTMPADGKGTTKPVTPILQDPESAPTPTPAPAGPVIPTLGGYTRALAERKLAALGLTAEASLLVTDGPTGVVVRQIPAAGSPLVAGTVVRLFINLGRS